MKLSPRKINAYLSLKLPVAFLCGVRVKTITASSCRVTVKHRWINQNPFDSMFWAVQGMAAELSTGALVMTAIKESGQNISMLVASNNASFSKKATGKITFMCTGGKEVSDAIEKAITTKEGQTFWLNAIGTNEDGTEVSNFNFEWTVKMKS